MKDLVVIPYQELEERLGALIEQKLKEANDIPPSKADDSKGYATRKEVAKKLRISLPTLNSLTKEGILTGYRLGNRLLYKSDEVEQAIEQISTQKYKRHQS